MPPSSFWSSSFHHLHPCGWLAGIVVGLWRYSTMQVITIRKYETLQYVYEPPKSINQTHSSLALRICLRLNPFTRSQMRSPTDFKVGSISKTFKDMSNQDLLFRLQYHCETPAVPWGSAQKFGITFSLPSRFESFNNILYIFCINIWSNLDPGALGCLQRLMIQAHWSSLSSCSGSCCKTLSLKILE